MHAARPALRHAALAVGLLAVQGCATRLGPGLQAAAAADKSGGAELAGYVPSAVVPILPAKPRPAMMPQTPERRFGQASRPQRRARGPVMLDHHPPPWQVPVLTRPFAEVHSPGLPVHLNVKAASVLRIWANNAAAAETAAKDRNDAVAEKYMRVLRSSLAVMASDIAHRDPDFVLALASNTGDIKAIATVTTSPGKPLQGAKIRQIIVNPQVKQRRGWLDKFLNQLDDQLGTWMGAVGDELRTTGFDQVIEDDMEDIFEDAREEIQKKGYETLADRTFRTVAGSRRIAGPTAAPGGILDAQLLFRIVSLEM